MRRRTKILIVVTGLALVLSLGFATTALASDEDSSSPMSSFVSKVAGILGLDEDEVADAFNQAHQEMQGEAIRDRLDNAVENGDITEEEADEIQQWRDSKPEALEKLGPLGDVWVIGRHGDCMGHREFREQNRHCWMDQVFDEQVSGTIASISEDGVTITVTTDDGSEVSFEYTENTRFELMGVTSVEEGQTVEAWCWENASGELTARIVKVQSTQSEDTTEDSAA